MITDTKYLESTFSFDAMDKINKDETVIYEAAEVKEKIKKAAKAFIAKIKELIIKFINFFSTATSKVSNAIRGDLKFIQKHAKLIDENISKVSTEDKTIELATTNIDNALRPYNELFVKYNKFMNNTKLDDILGDTKWIADDFKESIDTDVNEKLPKVYSSPKMDKSIISNADHLISLYNDINGLNKELSKNSDILKAIIKELDKDFNADHDNVTDFDVYAYIEALYYAKRKYTENLISEAKKFLLLCARDLKAIKAGAIKIVAKCKDISAVKTEALIEASNGIYDNLFNENYNPEYGLFEAAEDPLLLDEDAYLESLILLEGVNKTKVKEALKKFFEPMIKKLKELLALIRRKFEGLRKKMRKIKSKIKKGKKPAKIKAKSTPSDNDYDEVEFDWYDEFDEPIIIRENELTTKNIGVSLVKNFNDKFDFSKITKDNDDESIKEYIESFKNDIYDHMNEIKDELEDIKSRYADVPYKTYSAMYDREEVLWDLLDYCDGLLATLSKEYYRAINAIEDDNISVTGYGRSAVIAQTLFHADAKVINDYIAVVKTELASIDRVIDKQFGGEATDVEESMIFSFKEADELMAVIAEDDEFENAEAETKDVKEGELFTSSLFENHLFYLGAYSDYIESNIENEKKLLSITKTNYNLNEATALQEANIMDEVKLQQDRFINFMTRIADRFRVAMEKFLNNNKKFLENHKDILLNNKWSEEKTYKYTGDYIEGANRCMNTPVKEFNYEAFAPALREKGYTAILKVFMAGAQNFDYKYNEGDQDNNEEAQVLQTFKDYFIAAERGESAGKFSNLNAQELYNFCYDYTNKLNMVNKDLTILKKSTNGLLNAVNKERREKGENVNQNSTAPNPQQSTTTQGGSENNNSTGNSNTTGTNESAMWVPLFEANNNDNNGNNNDGDNKGGLEIGDNTPKTQDANGNTKDNENPTKAKTTEQDIRLILKKWTFINRSLILSKLTALQTIAKDYMNIIRAQIEVASNKANTGNNNQKPDQNNNNNNQPQNNNNNQNSNNNNNA